MNPDHHKKDLQKIIKRYVAGNASEEEIVFIERYYHYLDKVEQQSIENDDQKLAFEEENFNVILNNISSAKAPKKLFIYRYTAAAVVLLSLIGVSLYLILNPSAEKVEIQSAKNKPLDVLPGTNKAVLTLGNGSKVVLDGKTASNLSDRDGLKISKTNNGQLVYTITEAKQVQNKVIASNTIQTPRGGQYQVVLPDGSKVWLNAASSLTYPEIFVGKERKVKLTGEAYFEVAKNKNMPFIVNTQSQNVEVLGTHFNINSYMDEQTIKTTLLEGSVKVSNNQFIQILKPGDQSIAGANGNAAIKLVHNVDTDDETAWKNGQFSFNNASLKTILNQLERWYDVKIDYSAIPQKRYNGMVPKKANLSQVLNMLELTGNIKFQIEEGRKLKVIEN
ncbi:FecR family protein [Pedobacter changchengzhani]|uniref:FecR family protein n=1 Tax=Pedobacter changchengzhani TaxID=2529274 RepID=A0A4R5MLV8_9SPHI|nr:FecR family protein [Pedobacter changchengzhani]TDG36710.1 FecR family protein [Pedobacter changchengzhani]